ncbi:MAG: DUF3035 domain-containing protein [Cognatishimia sp.]|uniref:DUF3035 domain-containing protein n=1 Tax=Cognatishimia sp. TaxID=2211648 RepID=UPI003B8DF2DF
MRVSRAVIFGFALLVSACANERGIRVLSSDDAGPDEFSIIPTKPLSQPENYASLPTPTPGGGNLTDQDPQNDAVVALGGRAQATPDTGTFASGDAALVSYAARNGSGGGIREQLAEDDEKVRGRFSRFTGWRLAKPDRYNEVYRFYHLNAYAELARWRAAGVKTPTAPPPQ